MNKTSAKMIVVGGLNTDIVAAGVDTLLGPGELSRSGEIFIGPGGKSSNIARMSACLLGPERVRFVIFGHTHVAYARPIKDDEGTCEGEHQERAGIRPSQWEINTGSWTPVFDERMMLRQNGDEVVAHNDR